MRSSISRSFRRIVAGGRDHRYSSASHGNGPAGLQPERDVRLLQRALHVVAHQHPRAPGAPPDQRLDQLGRGRIQVRARLVEQEQRRVVEHRASDREPLNEPLRQVAHGLVGAAGHLELAEDGVDAGVRDTVESRVVAQVLAPAQLAVEERLVAHVAHLRREPPALVRERGAEHARAAAVRPEQPGEHAEQRRLARAVAAEDRERLALLDPHADAAERDPLAVPPLEAFELDRSHGAEAYAPGVARMVGINHVALEVGDVDEAVEFYGRIFESSCAAACTGWRSSTWATSSWRSPRSTTRRPARIATSASSWTTGPRAEGAPGGRRRAEAAAASTSATRGATWSRSSSTPRCSSRRRRP